MTWNDFSHQTCLLYNFSGAPKILLDSLQREIIAPVGEPYRIRIPFKGSPAPTATWYNVRIYRVVQKNCTKLMTP